MTFCKSCGNPIEGQFCARCGAAAPVSTAAPPPAQAAAQSAASAGMPYVVGGAAAGAASYAQSPQPQPLPQQQPQYAPPSNAVPGIGDNVAAGLCYLVPVLVPILFLVMAPYNQRREVRFHAFNSIFFGVASVALSIALLFASGLLAAIPVVGWIIGLMLNMALGIGTLIVWLILMVKAFNGQRMMLPVIGPLADQQAVTV